jgi:hypothetical protein
MSQNTMSFSSRAISSDNNWEILELWKGFYKSTFHQSPPSMIVESLSPPVILGL